jgi:Flp pilus assembly pilin Flp
VRRYRKDTRTRREHGRINRERGATAVEYALVVGLIGIGIITAVSTLQSKTSSALKKAGTKTVAANIRYAGENTNATRTFHLDGGESSVSVGSSVITNTPGIMGNAYTFSGTSDPSWCTTGCVVGDKIDDDSLDARLGSISVGIWAKTTSGGQAIIMRKSDSSGAHGWTIYGLSPVTFRVGNVPNASVSSAGNYADGQWHFLVGVLDRPAGTLKVYVDGQERGSTSAAALAGIDLKTIELPLGINSWNLIPITLDEPMIWKKALTQDEIDLLYGSVDR